MSLGTIAVWAFVVVAVGLLVELAVVIVRLLREAQRVERRIRGLHLVSDEQQARALDAVARLNAAAAEAPALVARANTAIATIRSAVPPSLPAAVRVTIASVRLLRGAIDHF